MARPGGHPAGSRLLPALVVVLAAAAVLTILIQPETRWETFADQSLASLGYYQNWELANTASDYLRAGEAVSPLQHIWSMSVQGQFYIAFLALIFGCAWVFRRVFGRHMRIAFITLLSVLTIASFVYAIFAHNADQATAYYNSFARAWELLLGALVGALVPHLRWPMWLRTTAAVIALAAILGVRRVDRRGTRVPGPVGAGAGRRDDAVHPVRGQPGRPIRTPAVGCPHPTGCWRPRRSSRSGAMAYSLYLWHWPLLIFYLSYTGRPHVNFLEGAVRASRSPGCWHG